MERSGVRQGEVKVEGGVRHREERGPNAVPPPSAPLHLLSDPPPPETELPVASRAAYSQPLKAALLGEMHTDYVPT
ncbi:unnamed protein product [Gadus morhua 'NCC']